MDDEQILLVLLIPLVLLILLVLLVLLNLCELWLLVERTLTLPSNLRKCRSPSTFNFSPPLKEVSTLLPDLTGKLQALPPPI